LNEQALKNNPKKNRKGGRSPFFTKNTIGGGGELCCSIPATPTTTHSEGERGEGSGQPATGHDDVGGVAKPRPWL